MLFCQLGDEIVLNTILGKCQNSPNLIPNPNSNSNPKSNPSPNPNRGKFYFAAISKIATSKKKAV